jgi:mitochondrial fission protein ELM1
MIIGGAGAGYRYEDRDWENLADVMTVLANKYGIKWLLTTSRRTGDVAEQKLKKLLPENMLASCVWYATDPQHVMLAYLGASELVFCTEDSMSMIAESIASGRAVVTLSPRKSDPEVRYIESLQHYVDKTLICRFKIESAGGLSSDDFKALKPLQTANSFQLAEKLRFIFCSPAEEDAL